MFGVPMIQRAAVAGLANDLGDSLPALIGKQLRELLKQCKAASLKTRAGRTKAGKDGEKTSNSKMDVLTQRS